MARGDLVTKEQVTLYEVTSDDEVRGVPTEFDGDSYYLNGQVRGMPSAHLSNYGLYHDPVDAVFAKLDDMDEQIEDARQTVEALKRRRLAVRDLLRVKNRDEE